MENYSNISTEELLRAASKKDADAQVELAYRFANGVNCDKNIASAVEWGEKAYTRGRHDVAALLAKLYFNGDDIYCDTQKAFFYCKECDNDVDCLCMLANEFYSGKHGVPQDNDKAFACISKALNLCTDSQAGRVFYYMGNMYFEGCGVEQNTDEAVNWYLKSASYRYCAAYIALANCSRLKKDFRKAKFYAEKACDCGDYTIMQSAMKEYNSAIRLIAEQKKPEHCKLSDIANEYDRNIHEVLRKINNNVANYNGFDKEANRLIKNAQTFDRIGNYKKVYPTYERVADEYPHDFRGWYNMARVFTNNFAVYSILSTDGYGKMDMPEYYENMTYAQRTVEECFENDILKVYDDYKNGCVDISIEELKNTLYSIYESDDCLNKAAEYARQYEDKITYLYNNKPCNVTALALHVLLKVLNNDNIKKYNEKVRLHNQKLNEKIEGKVNDYIIELAQRMKIENPKEYQSNAQAMETIESSPEIQEEIANYRKAQMESLEYYSEITNVSVCDVFDSETFGADTPYANYMPQNEFEYDDDFVDFIVAFAEKCSIQMRGYEAFYSPAKKKANAEYISSENTKDAVRLDYFNKFSDLKNDYTEMMSHKSRAFDELTEIVSEYIEIYSLYEKASSANVFMQVFKGKELKEDKADIQDAYDAVCVKLDEIKKKILENAKTAINELNADFANRYPQLNWNSFIYDEDSFNTIINNKFEKIKNGNI